MIAALSHDRRTFVTIALSAIGPEPGVIEGLRQAIDDPDQMVRSAALAALGALRPAADATLRELADHPVESVRSAAAEALQTESTVQQS
jgi:HEAT repeat protein